MWRTFRPKKKREGKSPQPGIKQVNGRNRPTNPAEPNGGGRSRQTPVTGMGLSPPTSPRASVSHVHAATRPRRVLGWERSGGKHRRVRAQARAESISKASLGSPRTPRSLLAPPLGSSRRCPICSRGNLLLLLSSDGRRIGAARHHSLVRDRDREGKLPWKALPRLALQVFRLLSGSLSGLRCTAARGWVWVCSGLHVDALRLRSRCRCRRSIRRGCGCCFRLGAGPGLSFHLLWLWVGIGGGE